MISSTEHYNETTETHYYVEELPKKGGKFGTYFEARKYDGRGSYVKLAVSTNNHPIIHKVADRKLRAMAAHDAVMAEAI